MNIKNDMNSGKTRSNLAVVNTETWEIISEDVASYRTVEQQEAYRKLKQKENLIASARNDNEPFIFADMNKVKEVTALRKLSFKSLGYYAVLTTYADYSNTLKLNEQSNVPMDKNDLKDALGIKSDTTINTLLKELKSAGMITEITVDKYGKKYTAFTLDTDILFKGKGTGVGVTDKVKIWQANVQKAFNKGKGTVSVTNLGLLFSVIPYVNIATNVLAYNIEEADGNKVQGIAITDLAEMLDLDPTTLQRNMSSAKFEGRHIFGKVQSGHSKFIKVNPLIVYRKAGKPDVASYIEFTAKVGKPPKKGAK